MPFYVFFVTVHGHISNTGVFEAADDALADIEFKARTSTGSKEDGVCVNYRRCELDASLYYPRMARPQLNVGSYIGHEGLGPLYIPNENAQTPLPHDKSSLSTSLNQLSIMVEQFKEIFKSVEPTGRNLQSFGSLIRNVLLLAAMEFENECKGVLNANGYKPVGGGDRWTTVDFVKTLRPLRLGEYQVRLGYYPNLQPWTPFAGWSSVQPTQTLPWYAAYNAVKHDREVNFHQSTIENALNALIGCAIMLAAQHRLITNWKDQIGAFFQFSKHPDWRPEELYINRSGAAATEQWTSIQYNF